jgi:hypothetical protein
MVDRFMKAIKISSMTRKKILDVLSQTGTMARLFLFVIKRIR